MSDTFVKALASLAAGIALAGLASVMLTWRDVELLKNWKDETQPLEANFAHSELRTQIEANRSENEMLQAELLELRRRLRELEVER